MYIGVLSIARENAEGFEEPTELFHFGYDPIQSFTWASSESVITVSKDGILRKWRIDEPFFVYEFYLVTVATVDHILYEDSSLAVVIGDVIYQYKEVDGQIMKDSEPLNVPGLSAVVLHNLGSQLSYAGTQRGLLWSSFNTEKVNVTQIHGQICHLSCSLDSGFLLVTTANGVVHVLDGASRHSLYEVPVSGATAAFYSFGDRYIVAHKAGTLVLWEASSPSPVVIPETDLQTGFSMFCSGVDCSLSTIQLIDNIPKRLVILQPPLDCRPPGYRLQTQPCTTIADLPRCIECQDGEICTFRGMRFLPSTHGNAPLIRDSRSYPLLFWTPNASEDLLRSIKSFIATAIQPLLKEELSKTMASDGLVNVKINPCYTQSCDGCLIVLMGTFWTCQRCGRDICHKCCRLALTTLSPCQSQLDAEHDFIPATHFPESQLVAEISRVKDALDTLNDFNHGDIAHSIQQGFPCLISCDIKEPLTPQFFTDHYDGVPCNIVTSDGLMETTTVDKFFMEYGKRKSVKKLKDWPPSNILDRDLARKFYESLPYKDLMTPSGPLNLASCYPAIGTVQPDLGPKMYAGMAGTETELHMDHSDAVNLMFHGEAMWWIFDARDASKVERYLKEAEKGTSTEADEDFSQLFSGVHFLKQQDLKKIQRDYDVKPKVFIQKPGQAIVIPAGCPHQVSNKKDSIKLAVDFVSVFNINRQLELMSKISETNRSGMTRRIDLVGFKALLIYAWMRWTGKENFVKDDQFWVHFVNREQE